MAKSIDQLNLQYIKNLEQEHKDFYIDKRIRITMHANAFVMKNLILHQPYRIYEGRIMFITQGNAKISVNLDNYNLEKGIAVVALPNTIFEILEMSDDFNFMGCSFPIDLPIIAKLGSLLAMNLHDDQCTLMNEYFHLLWHEVHQPKVRTEVLNHLQAAMLMELYRMNEMQHILHDVGESREYAILHNFIRLVIEHSTLHRNISFYAGKLCITPNHLGSVVKQASGLTVMQWINRFIIQEAKVMLKYSNNSILEISERLNFPNVSFFSRFFKRETGFTPNEYRKL